MTTFVLIHGGGDVGWYWHLLEAELRARGHDVVAPDLPCEDDSAGLGEYADAVVEAIGERTDLVVVGQSYGGFTAPLVAARLPVDLLVLLAAMIPSPGKRLRTGGPTPAMRRPCRNRRLATAAGPAATTRSSVITTVSRVPWPRRRCAGHAMSRRRPGVRRGRLMRGRT